MRYTLLGIIILVIYSVPLFAQSDSAEITQYSKDESHELLELKEDVESLRGEVQGLIDKNASAERRILGLRNINSQLLSQIDSLSATSSKNADANENLQSQLENQNTKLSGEISATKESTSQRVTELDKALSKNTIYWVMAVIILGLLTLLVFLLLRKQMTDNESSITAKITQTRQKLEQEGIRLDEKLVEVMERQLKLAQEDRSSEINDRNSEQDHSLALKVADEIVRIEKNISQMDESTKGLKQLSKAVERIRDNFAANGYEMVDMIGKPYDEGLKVTANFRPDETLESGMRIITRIIKPQVNYKGAMIQSAQIEVSQGE
jgi:hypothetical protein